MNKRSEREGYLRNMRMFETLDDEQIAKVADVTLALFKSGAAAALGHASECGHGCSLSRQPVFSFGPRVKNNFQDEMSRRHLALERAALESRPWAST